MDDLQLIDLYKTESMNVFNNIPSKDILKLFELVLGCYENGNKIFICGNGGNAGFVQNFVVDLNLHPFVSEDKSSPMECKKRLNVVNLCDSPATMTGILNDFGGDFIFSEQLKYQAGEGDLLLGFTGSGNSKNIIKAIEQAKIIKMKVAGITKSRTSKIAMMADCCIFIEGTSQYPGQMSGGGNEANFYFEDNLSTITHIICGLLKQKVQNGS